MSDRQKEHTRKMADAVIQYVTRQLGTHVLGTEREEELKDALDRFAQSQDMTFEEAEELWRVALQREISGNPEQPPSSSGGLRLGRGRG